MIKQTPQPTFGAPIAPMTGAGPAIPGIQDLYGNTFVKETVADTEAETAAASADIKAAITHRDAQARCVDGVIRRALALPPPDDDVQSITRDALLHNAAEWIEAGEVELSILSPTHDSADRPGGSGGGLAMFDSRKKWPDLGGSYTDSNAGIEWIGEGTHGQTSGDGTQMSIIDPRSATQAEATLIHEVQHDADQHNGAWAVDEPADESVYGDIPEDMRPLFDSMWRSYPSEFRAFWIMGDDGSTDTVFGSKNDPPMGGTIGGRDTAFQNLRQEEIFQFMVKSNYTNLVYFYAHSEAFRDMVHNTTGPDSGNLVDSIRIQALSEALVACKPSQTSEDAEVQSALSAADGLDPLDRRWLASSQSAPFWKQAGQAMSADVLKLLKDRAK